MDKLHTIEQHRLKLLALLKTTQGIADDVDTILLHRVKSNASNDDLFLLKHKVDGLKQLANEVERSLFQK